MYRMESLSYVVFTSPISAARFKNICQCIKAVNLMYYIV